MAAPYYVYGGNLLNREKYTSVVNTAYGQRRYFSSIDTDIYFGNVPIDEMVAFDFMIDEKKIPIFGYNNFTPKRIITGQKNIQGSFAINFTQTFNLKNIIDGLDDSIYANAYEEAQFYCGDDNQALFGKGFDITLSYGDHHGEGSYNSCSQTLVGCYITSYRQAFDTSGEPILDMYTFIAKDLVLNVDLTMEVPKVEEYIKAENDDTLTKEEQPQEYEYMVISSDHTQLESEISEHPETVGVYANPLLTYDYDGVFTLSSMILAINKDKELEDVEAVLEITDIAYEWSIKKFTLSLASKASSTYDKVLKGTEIQAGATIKNVFSTGAVDKLQCDLHLKCTCAGKEFNETQRLFLTMADYSA